MLFGKQLTANLPRLLPWRKFLMPFATEQTLSEHSGEISTFPEKTFSCREIVFLKEFGSHPNIIQLLNVHRAANDKDLYLVFEFMETDLHHVIKKGNILKGIHRQYIMYQLFKVKNLPNFLQYEPSLFVTLTTSITVRQPSSYTLAMWFTATRNLQISSSTHK